MLNLYLFRHAKSSWKSGESEDFGRTLNSRGRAAAAAMASHLALSGLTPDVIVCSAAQRARETLAFAVAAFGEDCAIDIEHDLYLADAATLLERVKALPETAQRCMMIGHNPGFHELALRLAGDGSADDIASLHAKFPTAAVAEIAFALPHWRDITPGAGRLQRFLTPRTLPADS